MTLVTIQITYTMDTYNLSTSHLVLGLCKLSVVLTNKVRLCLCSYHSAEQSLYMPSLQGNMAYIVLSSALICPHDRLQQPNNLLKIKLKPFKPQVAIWLHHTAHCTEKIVSARYVRQFCVSRKGGTGGGGWCHPQGDMHMVVAKA